MSSNTPGVLGAVASRTLSGRAEAEYVDRFAAILRAARLNSQYPESRRMSAHVGAMGPRVHRGLYESLQVNSQSGLPTYREWTRVQTDVTIAADQLNQLGARAALAARAQNSAAGVDIHHKQLAKFDYYSEIARLALAPLDGMQIALRRIEAAQRTAHFHVVFDKLDASGVFVRYSIDLAQRSSVWGTPAVVLNEETARHTEEFKALIYQFSSLDAEFTFAKLTALEGLSVERVLKGTVGPIYWGDSPAPEPIASLLAHEPQGFVAVFALDTAASDVTQNQNNDPLGALYASTLSAEVRHSYAQAREAYGYRVFKDRKFVASAGIVAPLRQMCESMGTQNIIYT
ncbi:MAG: hypothetical protein H0U74_16460, partial [Bradymonadaceae bacterium]|nr:hypothetical protein [Lujinxingiaceae bacterium]